MKSENQNERIAYKRKMKAYLKKQEFDPIKAELNNPKRVLSEGFSLQDLLDGLEKDSHRN